MIDLRLGDCLDVLRTMEAESVDAVVTDPPYGLSFMGKRWDYDVPSTEIWAECLRVLKPGGHLLAFAGTRTQHRMAVRIEDAGFEIRDMIFWCYGSGFPKSLDVGKAIDKAAGAEREVVGVSQHSANRRSSDPQSMAGDWKDETERNITAPAPDDAKQWDGWGTALKPSFESLTFATKPLDLSGHCAILISSLTERIESCRQIANNADKSSRRSQADSQGEKTNTVLGNAATRTGEAPANETENGKVDGTSWEAVTSESIQETELIALNTLLSWRRTLEGVSEAARTSTTSTAFEMITDWKILSYCLSQITPADITKARFNPSGLSADALRAVEYLNASLACCANTLALSALAPAMSLEAENCRGVGVSPNLDPCIMARKPLAKGNTVVANVLAHGTGALNVDGCRVPGLTGQRLSGSVVEWEQEKNLCDSCARLAASPAKHSTPGTKDTSAGNPAEPTTSAKGENTLEDTAKATTGCSAGLFPEEPVTGQTADSSLSIGASGKMPTAQFQLDMKSTTSTAKGTTTGLRTCNVCGFSITDPCTNGSTPASKSGTPNMLVEQGSAAPTGRWPSNFIHDGSDEVVECFPQTTPSPSKPVRQGGGQGFSPGAGYGADRDGFGIGYGDTGSAARFFYVAKTSKADRDDGCASLPLRTAGECTDRDEGSDGLNSPRAGAGRNSGSRNNHPTVKPTDLMRYLCRLVTPPGGVVLDPFMGSGSTGRGAVLEGFRFVGIEMDPEYVEIARHRIAAASDKARASESQMILF